MAECYKNGTVALSKGLPLNALTLLPDIEPAALAVVVPLTLSADGLSAENFSLNSVSKVEESCSVSHMKSSSTELTNTTMSSSGEDKGFCGGCVALDCKTHERRRCADDGSQILYARSSHSGTKGAYPNDASSVESSYSASLNCAPSAAPRAFKSTLKFLFAPSLYKAFTRKNGKIKKVKVRKLDKDRCAATYSTNSSLRSFLSFATLVAEARRLSNEGYGENFEESIHRDLECLLRVCLDQRRQPEKESELLVEGHGGLERRG